MLPRFQRLMPMLPSYRLTRFTVPRGSVYVVGDNGTILHSNGGNVWEAQTSGTNVALQAVWGSATGDVYAAGPGIMLHYQ